MMRRGGLAIWMAVSVSSSCGSPGPRVEADRIFYNAVVWTGAAEPAGSPPSALALWRDRIMAVGSDQQVLDHRGGTTELLDLQGGFLMPGFIDNHTHFVDGGFQLLGLDLRSARDEREFAERIGQRASQLEPGVWILGGDWDHEAWPSRQIPQRALIDSATPRTPVFVTRLDGHMGLANSLALQLAGITSATPDPPGGQIVRESDGSPTGMLKDAAMDLVFRVIPERSDSEIRRAIEAALREAGRLGVTTVNAMTNFREVRIFQQLDREKELTVRIYAITPLPDYQRLERAGLERAFGGDTLWVGAVKAFVDGSLGSTTAWFHEPYLDAPSTSGLPSGNWFPEGNLRRLILSADAAGLQLAIHAIGDRANDELLDIFQEVGRREPTRPRRFRIEHAQHLTRAAIERLAGLGVIASMQPYHAIDDGRWAEKRIGPERIQTTYAFRSLLDAGVLVTFGSDWTVAPLNPLLGVYAAVTRRTLDGRNPNGWVPQEKIEVEEALACYTRNSAYAIFQEHRLGTLEAGKLADLVVLSANPFQVAPAELENIRVVQTWVGGLRVH